MKESDIVSVADRHVGAQYPFNFKCVSFIRMIYSEVGLSIDFSEQPIIRSYDGLSDPNNIGKIVFLIRRGSVAYLYSHVALIYDYQSVVHYSRHMNKDGIRRVEISSFSELLEVYNLVPNPYVCQPQKVKTPHL